MTREDIIRMAHEAGFDALLPSEEILGRGRIYTGSDDEISDELERFANLVAAAERNKVAQWMIDRSYATGHGDTVEDLLKELEWQVREEERELCAQMCEEIANKPSNVVLGVALDCAAAIRARGREMTYPFAGEIKMTKVIKDGKEVIEWERVDLTYHADGNVGIGTPPQVKSALLVMGEPVERMRISMTDGIGITPGSESTAFSFTQPAQEWARVDKDGNVTHLDMDLCVEGPRNAYTALAVAIWNKAIDECIEIVARHGGSVEIEAAIRARGEK